MLGKYYSLDECLDSGQVIEKLDDLQSDGKIYYSAVESDVIKIRDGGLSPKEMKDLLSFFEKNDVIEYLDYEDIYENYEDEDDYEDDYEDEEYDF